MASAITMEDSSPNPNKTQPVMSLLEKYSTIHQSIDHAREETTKVRAHITETRQKIEFLRQERSSMEDEIQLAEKERQVLTEETEQAISDVEKLQSKKALVTSELACSKRNLDSAKRISQEYHHSFLQEARSFRASCKRLCTRAHILGIGSMAALQSYATVKLDVENQGLEELRRHDHSRECNEKDESVNLAKQHLQASQSSLSKAEQAKERICAEKRALLEKAESRASRKQQLQSQLLRIQKDVEELESSIAAADEDAREAREMGANFEKGEPSAVVLCAVFQFSA